MKFLALFGLGRIAPLEAEIIRLRIALQNEATEKLIANDRLQSALDDKSHLWGIMGQSIQDMKIAYQMHINLQWQKQGLPAPYPEAPGIPAEKQTAYEKPPAEDMTKMGLKSTSQVVAEYKKKFIDQYFNTHGKEPEVAAD